MNQPQSVTPLFNFIHLLGLAWTSLFWYGVTFNGSHFYRVHPIIIIGLILWIYAIIIGYMFKKTWIKYVAGPLFVVILIKFFVDSSEHALVLRFELFYHPIFYYTDKLKILFIFLSGILLTYNQYLQIEFSRKRRQPIEFKTEIEQQYLKNKSFFKTPVPITVSFGLLFLAIAFFTFPETYFCYQSDAQVYLYIWAIISSGFLVSGFAFLLKWKFAPHFSTLSIVLICIYMAIYHEFYLLNPPTQFIQFFILLFISSFTLIAMVFHPLTQGFLTNDDYENELENILDQT